MRRELSVSEQKVLQGQYIPAQHYPLAQHYDNGAGTGKVEVHNHIYGGGGGGIFSSIGKLAVFSAIAYGAFIVVSGTEISGCIGDSITGGRSFSSCFGENVAESAKNAASDAASKAGDVASKAMEQAPGVMDSIKGWLGGLSNPLYQGEPPEVNSGSSAQGVSVTGFSQFGSASVLNALWTQEQLAGSPSDKKISKEPADHSPPERQVPNSSPVQLSKNLMGSIRSVKTNRKLVALTFDLCERASEETGYEAGIVNYLRQNNIKATFYAGGKWMQSHPEKTQQLMADPLFEIGNHAWTHGNMRVLTGNEMKNQVLWTQAQYELLREDLASKMKQKDISDQELGKIPPIPLTFRCPYGTCSKESLSYMEQYGLPSVQWNIVTSDPWNKQSADGIAKVILQGIRPGSIIVAHANGRGWNTEESLSKFIPKLINEGYEFVTVTELLNAGTPEAAETCFENKPGDNAFYDKKVGKGTE